MDTLTDPSNAIMNILFLSLTCIFLLFIFPPPFKRKFEVNPSFLFHYWLEFLKIFYGDNRAFLLNDNLLYGCDLTKVYNVRKIKEYITINSFESNPNREDFKFLKFLWNENSDLSFCKNKKEENYLLTFRDYFKIQVGGDEKFKELLINMLNSEKFKKVFLNGHSFSEYIEIKEFLTFLVDRTVSFNFSGLVLRLNINEDLVVKVYIFKENKILDWFNINFNINGCFNFLKILKLMSKGLPVLSRNADLFRNKYITTLPLTEISTLLNKFDFKVNINDLACMNKKFYLHSNNLNSEIFYLLFFIPIFFIFSSTVVAWLFTDINKVILMSISSICCVLNYSMEKRNILLGNYKIKFYFAHIGYRLLIKFNKNLCIIVFGILRKLDIFSFCPNYSTIPVIVKSLATSRNLTYLGKLNKSLMDNYIEKTKKFHAELSFLLTETPEFKPPTSVSFYNLKNLKNKDKLPFYQLIHSKDFNIKGCSVTLQLFRSNLGNLTKIRYQPVWSDTKIISLSLDNQVHAKALSILELMEENKLDNVVVSHSKVFGQNYVHCLSFEEIMSFLKDNNLIFFEADSNFLCGAKLVELNEGEEKSLNFLGWKKNQRGIYSKLIEYTRLFWGDQGLSDKDITDIYLSLPFKGVVNKKWYCPLPNKKLKIYFSDLNHILMKYGGCIYKTQKLNPSKICLSVIDEDFFVKEVEKDTECQVNCNVYIRLEDMEGSSMGKVEKDCPEIVEDENTCKEDESKEDVLKSNIDSELEKVENELLKLQNKFYFKNPNGTEVMRAYNPETFEGWLEGKNIVIGRGKAQKELKNKMFNEWRSQLDPEEFNRVVKMEKHLFTHNLEYLVSDILSFKGKYPDIRLNLNNFIKKGEFFISKQKSLFLTDESTIGSSKIKEDTALIEGSSKSMCENYQLMVLDDKKLNEPSDNNESETLTFDLFKESIKILSKIKMVSKDEYKKEVNKMKLSMREEKKKVFKIYNLEIYNKGTKKKNLRTKIPLKEICKKIKSQWIKEKRLSIFSRNKVDCRSMRNKTFKYLIKKLKDKINEKLIPLKEKIREKRKKYKDLIERKEPKETPDKGPLIYGEEKKREELSAIVSKWNNRLLKIKTRY